MINHVRTLLLQQDGSNLPPAGYLGEEYVPSDFRSVSLPQSLLKLRTHLFGLRPDRARLNVLIRQLLVILHSSEMREFVYGPDSRVTYYPFAGHAVLDRLTSALTVVQTHGSSPPASVVLTQAVPDTGRMLFDWTVTVIDATHASVVYTPDASTIQTITLPINVAGGNSVVSLPGVAANMTLTPTPGNAWQVEYALKPPSLTAVLATLGPTLPEDTDNDLFGVSPVAPFDTFQNLWLQHPQALYRLGGLVLALAYRTDALRGGS